MTVVWVKKMSRMHLERCSLRNRILGLIIEKAGTDGDGFIDIAEWMTIAISHKR